MFLYYMKVHAPGCPVMITGIHDDAVKVNENDISKKFYQMYSNNRHFPTIADVCCISNTKDSLKMLRKRIYSVAIHLHCDQRNRC